MTHPSPIATGLAGRCPACGKGPMFESVLKVVPTCTVCGQTFAGEDSGDGPVPFIILIVGFIVVGTALVVEVKYGWPVWLHLVVWLPLASILCIGLLRPLKGLLIALQYQHRRHDFQGPT